MAQYLSRPRPWTALALAISLAFNAGFVAASLLQRWRPDALATGRLDTTPLRQALSLTAGQARQLEAERERLSAALTPLDAEREAAQARLGQLLDASPADRAAIEATLDDLNHWQRQTQEAVVNHRLRLHEFLTPAQTRTLTALMSPTGGGPGGQRRRHGQGGGLGRAGGGLGRAGGGPGRVGGGPGRANAGGPTPTAPPPTGLPAPAAESAPPAGPAADTAPAEPSGDSPAMMPGRAAVDPATTPIPAAAAGRGPAGAHMPRGGRGPRNGRGPQTRPSAAPAEGEVGPALATAATAADPDATAPDRSPSPHRDTATPPVTPPEPEAPAAARPGLPNRRGPAGPAAGTGQRGQGMGRRGERHGAATNQATPPPALDDPAPEATATPGHGRGRGGRER